MVVCCNFYCHSISHAIASQTYTIDSFLTRTYFYPYSNVITK